MSLIGNAAKSLASILNIIRRLPTDRNSSAISTAKNRLTIVIEMLPAGLTTEVKFTFTRTVMTRLVTMKVRKNSRKENVSMVLTTTRLLTSSNLSRLSGPIGGTGGSVGATIMATVSVKQVCMWCGISAALTTGTNTSIVLM